MTNAMIEIGLISVSVVLGILGLSPWAIILMVGVSLLWWGFVHRARLQAWLQASVAESAGKLAIALVSVLCGHFVAFGFGAAMHAMMGLQ
jgi:hypothetical protein